MILGVDFLQDYGLSVDFGREKVTGALKDGSFEVYFTEDNIKTVYQNLPVYSLERFTAKKGEAELVSAYIEGVPPETIQGQEFFYEAQTMPFSLPLLIHEGVVVHDGQKIQLLIEKSYDAQRNSQETFKKGTYLGRVSTIVETEVNVLENMGNSAEMDEDILQQVDLSHLPLADSSAVRKMLSKCAVVLSRGDDDIGCAGVTEHRIELHDTTPIRQKPRRFPDPVAQEIEKQCQELKSLDIIDYSRSPWSSPVVPIRKPDGTVRLCIDYRKLNKVTKADRFPMPNMTDLVYSLNGTEYFTSLDLVRGYYQVPLHPESRECTAFSTTKNHYEFKRLSFGLKNAPAAFQREMQEVLRGFPTKQVLVYIDDILIMSRSFDEHIALVGSVLATLAEYGIKVKPSKCSWFCSEVVFLGHIVGRHGVRKSEPYMKAVRDFPKPTTVKELRSFLGLANFQRKFVPNCSVLSRPLTSFMGLSDKTKLNWTAEMEESYENLKSALCSAMELAYPDYSADANRMEVSTDASGTGAGACLTQLQNGIVRVISYASTTFSRTQQNYSTIDRELAAIRWALRTFRGFLFGVPFLLFTDHRPLVYMNNIAQRNSRIARTMSELAEFDFEVRYRAGKDNQIADTLSRLTPALPSHPEITTDTLPDGLTVLTSVEGGGDALPKSLFAVLQHHRGAHNPSLPAPACQTELRQQLVNEVLKNLELYASQSDRLSKNKIQLAALPGQLMGDWALRAFTKIYSLDVWVHHGIKYPIIHTSLENPSTDPSKRVHLQCISGVHYNPLVENRFYQPLCENNNHTPPDTSLCVLEMSSDEAEDYPDIQVTLASEAFLMPPCSCPGKSEFTPCLSRARDSVPVHCLIVVHR